MGGPSFEVAEILPLLPKGAKVLDLGCGEGRNAFFLSQKGCDVTAVDRSEAGINKLLWIAEKYESPLKGVVQDITEFPLSEEYDLVMGHGVLYYLENAVWRSLLTKIKKHTRPGGFNILLFLFIMKAIPVLKRFKQHSTNTHFVRMNCRSFIKIG